MRYLPRFLPQDEYTVLFIKQERDDFLRAQSFHNFINFVKILVFCFLHIYTDLCTVVTFGKYTSKFVIISVFLFKDFGKGLHHGFW